MFNLFVVDAIWLNFQVKSRLCAREVCKNLEQVRVQWLTHLTVYSKLTVTQYITAKVWWRKFSCVLSAKCSTYAFFVKSVQESGLLKYLSYPNYDGWGMSTDCYLKLAWISKHYKIQVSEVSHKFLFKCFKVFKVECLRGTFVSFYLQFEDKQFSFYSLE